MSIDELEAAALKLEPKARARLASRLLESLDELTPEENARLWHEEAERRNQALDRGTLSSRSADERSPVMRTALRLAGIILLASTVTPRNCRATRPG